VQTGAQGLDIVRPGTMRPPLSRSFDALAAWSCALVLALTVAPMVRAQDAGSPDAGVRDASAPVLVPPRLLSGAELALPEGTEPLPSGSAVELQLDLGADGTVRDVLVLVPLREDIDPLVVEAARAMRFEPARRGDSPIPARVRFRFGVRADAPPPPEPDAGLLPETSDPDAGVELATLSDAGEPAIVDAGRRRRPEPILAFRARAVVVPPETGAATRVVLTAEELTTVPGTLGEPLRVVAALPGVARSPFGLGYYVVRGAAFENTGFFVDGFQVPLLYHLAAGPAVISSRLVERLDFYPGGYPARYGRLNAGIIALHTAPPDRDTFSFELELDIFRASALAILPLPDDRGAIAVAFRRSYYELVLPLLIDGISLSFTDWQVRLDYKLSRRVRASIFVFGSSDTLDTETALGTGKTATTSTTGMGYGFTRAIAKLEARLSGQLRLTWAGTIGEDATAVQMRQAGSGGLSLDLSAFTFGERLDLVWQPTTHLRTNVGLDLAGYAAGIDAALPLPPGFGEIPSPDFAPQTFRFNASLVALGTGAFVEQKVELGPVELTGGLRVDHYRYGEISTALLQPRIVARFAISPAVTLKAATGLFSQTPQPFQLLPNLGSPSLSPNRSWQSSAGVELKLPADIEIESQFFYTLMYGLARPSTGLVPDGEGARRQFFFDDGEGRSYGFELLVRRKVADGLYGWLSYTLSRSERFIEGGDPVPFTFDQTHMLNLAASYKLWRFRFGARFQLASGRPMQAVTGAVYDADSTDYQPILTGLTSRLPVYHQLDLRVDYEFPLGPLEASVFVEGINVYNAQNAEGLQYQYDFKRSFRLPGLPALGTVGFRLVY
jgi:hypothetical protein